MITRDELELVPMDELQDIRGIPFPRRVRYRRFLVSGPPGAGKSTLIGKIRGWPDEGFVDLSARNWWRIQALNLRPREIHLGIPFSGRKQALSVIDEEWVADAFDLEIEYDRIRIPPARRFFPSVDWRRRFMFEFQLPPAEQVFRDRTERARSGKFPVDRNLSPGLVARQLDVYRSVAWYFWKSGVPVYVRMERNKAPMRITGPAKRAGS